MDNELIKKLADGYYAGINWYSEQTEEDTKSGWQDGVRWATNSLPTKWTPITGEASLPTDDEALCVLSRYNTNGKLITTPCDTVKVLKKRWNVCNYTFYTILTKPVK